MKARLIQRSLFITPFLRSKVRSRKKLSDLLNLNEQFGKDFYNKTRDSLSFSNTENLCFIQICSFFGRKASIRFL